MPLLPTDGPYPAVGIYWYIDHDPTIDHGLAAPLGQLLVRTDTDALYFKSGFGNRDWTPLGGGSAGSTGPTGATGAASTVTGPTGATGPTGISGNAQRFSYVATGVEGDTFTLNLPAPRANTNYVAQVTGGGLAGFLLFDAPISQYTLTTIQVKASAPLLAGDTLVITVEDLAP